MDDWFGYLNNPIAGISLGFFFCIICGSLKSLAEEIPIGRKGDV